MNAITYSRQLTDVILRGREIGYTPDELRAIVERTLRADAEVDAELDGAPEIVVALHQQKTRVGILEVEKTTRIYSSGVTTEPPELPRLPQPVRMHD